MIFYTLCYYFWGQHCWWTETIITGNDFLFFISFHCPQLFYCSPCPTSALASLNMHVVSTNYPKTLVVNLIMTSHFTNSVYPVTMTTLHHCSILEFVRGHLIKQSPRASPDLCTPLWAIQRNAAYESENRTVTLLSPDLLSRDVQFAKSWGSHS